MNFYDFSVASTKGEIPKAVMFSAGLGTSYLCYMDEFSVQLTEMTSICVNVWEKPRANIDAEKYISL